jgi:hypothetical protein
MIKAKIVLHLFVKDGGCKGVARVAGAMASPTLAYYEGESEPLSLQQVCALAVNDWGVDFTEVKGPVALIADSDLLGGWELASSRITRRAIPIPERIMGEQPALRALDDSLAAYPRTMERPILMKADGGTLMLEHEEFALTWDTLRTLCFFSLRNWRMGVEAQEQVSIESSSPEVGEGGGVC